VLLGGPGRDTLVGGLGADRLDGGLAKDFLMARDGSRFDVVTCSIVNLATRVGRAQRDVVVADRRDVIRNRRYCAKVTFT
jgi:Ca2+-binding RTX toxin-like protein